MSKKSSTLIIVLLIAAGVASRLMPHPWNATPITAIALFASVYFGIRQSFFIVAATMLISDAVIGFYDVRVILSVYGALAAAAGIGMLVRRHKTILGIFLGALSSSVLFFLITNWAVWQFSHMYAHTLTGLMESFTLALPFFRNMLAGDIAYSGILFGAYEAVSFFSRRTSTQLPFKRKLRAAPGK